MGTRSEVAGSWLDGLELRARDVLSPEVYAYVSQGARDGVTTGAAVEAWRDLRFVPRVLRDVRTVDPSTSVLGTPLRMPLAVAPTTLQRAAHPDGELAMARAVAAAGSLLVLSSNAGTRFADIGATGVSWWLQAYLPQQRERALPMLEAAVAAGARAIVLTVDTPVVGTKYGDAAAVWEQVDLSSLRLNLGDAADDPKARDLGPDDLTWLAERTGLSVVVKGVLHPDDARVAADSGCAAVWVSNHGGRQLDRTEATARCLADVAQALADRPEVEVYVDGGLRNGLDLLAAVASGARVGFLGRLPFYALAAGGEADVARMFAELEAEFVESMALAGMARLEGAGPVVLPPPTSAAGRQEPPARRHSGADLRERPL